MLVICTHGPALHNFQSPETPPIHSTDTTEHSTVPGTVLGPEPTGGETRQTKAPTHVELHVS